jgi:Ca2+-binding EF-hand superfamily protein
MRPPLALLVLLLATAAGAARAQTTYQLFISPMGEPFRAGPGKPYPSEAWFAQADANHDGVISREEFRADALRFFKTLDADGDGKISEIEIHRYEQQIAPEIVESTIDTSNQDPGEDQNGNKKQTKLSTFRQGAAFYSFLNDPEPVRSADVDFNLKVTLDEWMAAADRRFKTLLPDGQDGLRLADMPKPPAQGKH